MEIKSYGRNQDIFCGWGHADGWGGTKGNGKGAGQGNGWGDGYGTGYGKGYGDGFGTDMGYCIITECRMRSFGRGDGKGNGKA